MICARHGRTSKTLTTPLGEVCGEARSERDRTPGVSSPEIVAPALRARLGIPEAVCARLPLEECSRCKHPAHVGKCGTAIRTVPGTGTEWCNCVRR